MKKMMSVRMASLMDAGTDLFAWRRDIDANTVLPPPARSQGIEEDGRTIIASRAERDFAGERAAAANLFEAAQAAKRAQPKESPVQPGDWVMFAVPRDGRYRGSYNAIEGVIVAQVADIGDWAVDGGFDVAIESNTLAQGDVITFHRVGPWTDVVVKIDDLDAISDQSEIVNLTPHELNIRREDGTYHTVPPSGTVARCVEKRTEVTTIAGIRVTRAEYDYVVDLPEPEEGKVFVTSALVARAVRERRRFGAPAPRQDVFCPGPAIRDADGKVVGCDGLSAI